MRYITACVIGTAMLFAAFLGAQEKGGKGAKKGFTLPPMIHLTVDEISDGGHIASKYTCAAGQNSPSPAINWTGAPANTQSYVLIMHDPDPVLNGSATNDVLHWAIFDIAGDAKGLPEGVKAGDQADGAKQIGNIAGMQAYLGPCPPAGHGDHHYTFEIYALNAKLGLPSSTSRADLLNAMNGKVIAKGVFIGMFGQK
ncbi:MAG: YbhB/YbcL family Raf kinase inhibitor-like protein [Acidobacteriia bacterium]|nr:YbhB/YbcL family Raf kinase inhibitor-like protein [Terriglobia bacterium]MBV8902168.1 YbhB/YbcL family Raf kinase inhibitor-like protein [Terriglobia bacterium]